MNIRPRATKDSAGLSLRLPVPRRLLLNRGAILHLNVCWTSKVLYQERSFAIWLHDKPSPQRFARLRYGETLPVHLTRKIFLIKKLALPQSESANYPVNCVRYPFFANVTEHLPGISDIRPGLIAPARLIRVRSAYCSDRPQPEAWRIVHHDRSRLLYASTNP